MGYLLDDLEKTAKSNMLDGINWEDDPAGKKESLRKKYAISRAASNVALVPAVLNTAQGIANLANPRIGRGVNVGATLRSGLLSTGLRAYSNNQVQKIRSIEREQEKAKEQEKAREVHIYRMGGRPNGPLVSLTSDEARRAGIAHSRLSDVEEADFWKSYAKQRG